MIKATRCPSGRHKNGCGNRNSQTKPEERDHSLIPRDPEGLDQHLRSLCPKELRKTEVELLRSKSSKHRKKNRILRAIARITR